MKVIAYDDSHRPVFRCKLCEYTFAGEPVTFPGSKQWTEGRAYPSFKDYLREEVSWSVHCDGLGVNEAALRAGVDWKTAKKWADWAENNLDLADMCGTWPSSRIRSARITRYVLQVADYPRSFSNPADLPWVLGAAYGELLYLLREVKEITAKEAQKYLQAFRKYPQPAGTYSKPIHELYLRLSAYQERQAMEAQRREEEERRNNPQGLKYF